MQVKALLETLDMGTSSAEFDTYLEQYFVETQPFRDLINNRIDVVAGDKGTGKTALYRMLDAQNSELYSLNGIVVITGFNPAGEPIFKGLIDDEVLAEGEYIEVWKVFVLALLGNRVLDDNPEDFTEDMKKLDSLLRRANLRTETAEDSSPVSIFARLRAWIGRVKSIGTTVTVNEQGTPAITPRIEFTGERDEPEERPPIRIRDALRLLNNILTGFGTTVWLALDRLDEAFQGYAEVQVPALRALLRAYLDLQEFDRIKLKLFTRRDLFSVITSGNFVNLTHINARKIEIRWENEDLFELLCQRIATSDRFIQELGAETWTNDQLFGAVLPQRFTTAINGQATWIWMLSRIRDGNGVCAPRNLIDLVKKAIEFQLSAERRSPREYNAGEPLISANCLKKAYEALSEERVNDTLKAEAGTTIASYIDRFDGAKAEHNEESIARILALSLDEGRAIIPRLKELGLFEQVGTSYKIPPLYRPGLHIIKGRAFQQLVEPTTKLIPNP